MSRSAASLTARIGLDGDRSFRMLLEAAPDAIVIVEHDSRVALVNAQAEKLFGYEREELIGRPVADLVPDELRAAHRRHEEDFLSRPRTRPMGEGRELEAVRKDGSRIPVEISLAPVETERGLLVTAAIREISSRLAIERELAERARRLEEANAELKELAHVASHDLAEPLRTISGFAQLLQERYEGQLDDEADDYIGFVLDGTRRMQALVDDLLVYSRAGSAEIEYGPVDLDRLVEHVVNGLGMALAETAAEIEHQGLPTVIADRSQLERLFANLLTNAVKFRREGTVPRVSIEAERDGEMWSVTVRDNGIGIDPRHAERVFGVFQRLHSTEEYPGTGIGLAICRQIVDRHGGEIRAQPASGGGTEIRFTLPASRDQL